VTNRGRFGKWSYYPCFGVGDLKKVLEGAKEKMEVLELEREG